MNNLDQIISRLQAQQPTLHGADELTDRIMQSLPEQPAKPKALLRRWAVAASIAVIFCLGVAAAVYYHSMESSGTVTREVDEQVKSAMESQDTETFVFDNVEMQAVADTLGHHYKVQPVFQSEEAKHMRLYFQVEKSKSIEEVVELLNHFSKVSVTLKDKQLIIK